MRYLFFLLLGQLLIISAINAQYSTWRKKFTGAGLTIGINPRNPHTVLAEGESGSLYISYDDGRTWNATSPPGVSAIRQIIVHPNDTNTILVVSGYSSSEGLRRSTDMGITWQTAISNFGIDGESVSYDLNHPDTMYAGRFDPGDVYKSTNRGATWTHQGIAGNYLCALATRPDSANILYSGTSGGTISKSTNGGVTWKYVKAGIINSAFEEVPKIVINPTNPMIAYATTFGSPDSILHVWKTSDGGEHWFKTAMQKMPTWALEIDLSNPETIYVGTFAQDSSTVFKSTDGGASWESLSSLLFREGFMWSLKVHPMTPDIVWLGMTRGTFGVSGIYRYASTNSIVKGAVLDQTTGDTIKNGSIIITSSHDSMNLALSGGKFTFGYYDGDSLSSYARAATYPYYVAHDSLTFTVGASVYRDVLMQKLPTLTFSGDVRSAHDQTPVASAVNLKVTTLHGDSIKQARYTLPGDFQFDSLYIEYPPIIQYTSLVVDPELPYMQSVLPRPDINAPVTIDVETADLLLLADSGIGTITSFYTTAFDQLHVTYNVWDVVRRGTSGLHNFSQLGKKIVIYPYGKRTESMSQEMKEKFIDALNQGCNILFTGQNFAEKNDTSRLLSNHLGIGFDKNVSSVYNKGTPGDLLNGITFLTSGPGGANNQTSRDALRYDTTRAKEFLWYGPSNIYGIAGVRIDSVGAGGKAIVTGIGFEAIIPDTMRRYVMRKIIGYFDGSIILDVQGQEKNNSKLPGEFTLYQNYPNPFNPTTNFGFRIAERGLVTLKIYSLLGEEIATVVNEVLTAGVYNKTWNASAAPSGVYFCKLQTTKFYQIKKLALVR